MTIKISKKWLIIIAIAAVIGVGVFFLVRYLSRGPFMYAGTLESSRVVLSARVPSDVEQILVAEGDTVLPGEVLMELSCDSYKIMAAQIDAEYNRIVALHARDHASQSELDSAAARKNDNDLKLKWCRITSPIAGVVTTKFQEVGESVAPGTPLITVSNPNDIWAYFYVPYEMLYKLRLGGRVVGILPEADGIKFPGTIIKISETAEFTPKNVQTREERMRLVYGVKVRFDNHDLILKSGMTIESDLLDETRQN